ncbi:MAG: glycosyltransferase [Halomonadaceae bacterium]|nr:MAG: glycosyltransferase [Halomonadaceae bacterium]
MSRQNSLKILFYLNVLLVALVLSYKAYLNVFMAEVEAVHSAQIASIERRLADRDQFSFAVVGNINNSIGLFQNRLIPKLNDAGIDFVVSAGNAVSGGGGDNYQALQDTLRHLQLPYLLTFGSNEQEAFGDYRFYERFGSHYFSFQAGNSRFIFLDATGKTHWHWQIRWLQDLLQRDSATHRLVFIATPLLPVPEEPVSEQEDRTVLQPPLFRQQLLRLFQQHQVTAVFSASLPLWDQQQRGNTRFVVTGGAGDQLQGTANSFYHYVRVTVDSEGVHIEPMPLATGQHPVPRQLESLWLFVYSLFYVSYLNFILLISALMLVAIKLYTRVFQRRDYYPDYDLDPSPWLQQPLRVAMFSNSYLPAINGVSVSIERLRQGLSHQGNPVLLIVPDYQNSPMGTTESGVLRLPPLPIPGHWKTFNPGNIFLASIRRRVATFQPDLVHLHHPFWLGSLGLLLARWHRLPTIYTYHTRLEQQAHFVPLPGLLFRNLIAHWLTRRFANRCNGIIVPTNSSEEYLHQIGVTTPTFVQPTGVDYERFQRVDQGALNTLRQSLGLTNEAVLITVARLSNEKNLDFIIDAIHRLRHLTPRVFRWLLVGDGQERQRLQQRIHQLQLQEHITLVGAVPPDTIANWYHLGDLFLFASRAETQGMVILEAMAAGLPVVAVRSSGIDDVILQGNNGFKTPQRLDAWCARVVQLLDDEPLRQTLADNAREFGSQHSVAAFAANIKTIYARVLARSSRR